MSGEKRASSDLLRRAQRAWSPSPGDAARVRQAIDSALANGAGTAPSKSPGRTPAAPWTSRLLVASAIAAASGGIGYWAGHRAGLREAKPMSTLAPRPEAPTAVASRPTSLTVAAASPAPVALPSLVPEHREPRGEHRGSGSSRQPETGSLTLEVQALRNAERALRDGNPGLALAFLEALDRQVPHGQLVEERDAAATLARCARGDHPFGVDLAEEFTHRHPDSVYRARVQQTCAATDSPAAGD